MSYVEGVADVRLFLPAARLQTQFPALSPFRAIADPTRRELLDLLAEGEQPVYRLAAHFAMTRPAISQHLRILRQAKLVDERRVGRERWYRLEPTALSEVSDWLRRYERFWR